MISPYDLVQSLMGCSLTGAMFTDDYTISGRPDLKGSWEVRLNSLPGTIKIRPTSLGLLSFTIPLLYVKEDTNDASFVLSLALLGEEVEGEVSMQLGKRGYVIVSYTFHIDPSVTLDPKELSRVFAVAKDDLELLKEASAEMVNRLNDSRKGVSKEVSSTGLDSLHNRLSDIIGNVIDSEDGTDSIDDSDNDDNEGS